MKTCLHVFLTLIVAGEFPSQSLSAEGSARLLVGVKRSVKSSVKGFGASVAHAEKQAAAAAQQMAGGSYRTLRKYTTGREDNYVCTMEIEYHVK